jgi:putative ABC transport system permease protein
MNWRKYFTRRRRDQELAREIEFHVAQEAEENMARGMSREAAQQAARRSLGNATTVREAVYEMNGWSFLDSLRQDVRFGLRQLRLHPGFTLTAVLSLALGIGANTAIFTLVDQIVLRLLPVKNPRELVQLRVEGGRFGSNTGDDVHTFSYPTYVALRDHSTVFAGLTGQTIEEASLSGDERGEMIRVGLVGGNFFQVFGVEPLLGRLLTPEDDTTINGHPVAVLQYTFWRNRFAGDVNIVGSTIRLNGTPFTVIGVSAPGFEGTDVGLPTEAWTPVTMKAAILPARNDLEDERSAWFYLFGRLKPGAGIEQAQAAMRVLYRQRQQEELQGEFFQRFPEERERFLRQDFSLVPAGGGQSWLRSHFEAPLIVLQWLVGVVLLIACTNVANLLLARATARQREVAIRGALGASRGQLIRQFLLESMMLAAAGGAAGLLLSSWMTRGLIRVLPFDPANLSLSTTPDTRILLFSAAITLLTALLFGLAPALRGTRVAPGTTLKQEAGAIAGGGHVRLRKVFVAVQVGLSCLLLIGAGLFARTLANLQNVELGFDSQNVVMFSVRPSIAYDAARKLQVYRSLLEGLAAVPGVKAAGANRTMLLTGGQWDGSITMPGVAAQDGNPPWSFFNAVTPGYFEALGIPVTAGRDLSWSDWGGSRSLCLVNQELVDEYLGGENPVGRFLGQGRDTPPDREIIGVFGNARYEDVRGAIPRQVFVSLDSKIAYTSSVNVYARVVGDARAVMPLLREHVRRVDANLVVSEMRTLDEQLNRRLSNERLLSFLSVGFALLASLLAVVGLHGVLTFVVARRTRELGIRMALGADRGRVVRLVMGEMLLVVVLGTAVGVLAGLLFGRLVQSQLFGVNGADAPVYLISVTALLAAALGAALAPAWRASRIDPMTALRQD